MDDEGLAKPLTPFVYPDFSLECGVARTRSRLQARR